MSMIGNLARIPNETRLKLHQSPGLITSLLYPGSPAPAPAKPGFFGQLFGKKAVPPPAAAPALSLTPIPADDLMDLDKAWHGLHFLFTGSDWEGDFPQGFIVTCGEPVGDEDVGYGPARSFTPDEVEKIAKFLGSQNETTLRQRLNPEKMTELEIYPNIWDRITNPDEENEEWDYLLDGFRQMKQFVQETAAKRMALLVYLN
jgi:hypothetical protein